MISREEVAKKLREAGKELDNTFDKSDDGDEFLAAFIAIDSAIGQPKRSPFEFSPFFNRLADLIDPTCTADIKREDDGIDAQPYYTSSCGNCGALWDTITGAALLPKYCPHCGARVVRDEA